MRKGVLFFLIFTVWTISGMAANRTMPDKFINKSLYENVYPSTLNQSKNNNGMLIVQSEKKNKNTQSTTSSAPMGKRSVAKRTTNARSATKSAQNPSTKTASSNNSSARRVIPRGGTARSATKSATTKQSNNRNTSNRRVVARGAQGANTARTARLIRGTTTTTSSTTTGATSSQRCFADYKNCMDSYCERDDAAYSRCFCSAKLAQIDSKYQPKIDSLVQEIIKLKYNTDATDAEIKSYWDETVGVYTGTNPWVNIDNALNIDWADTETRFRGQNAFTAGHTYCVNHLRTCSYMATNLRDAYKSEIERDCTAYEKTLEKIQIAAESVIESYDK